MSDAAPPRPPDGPPTEVEEGDTDVAPAPRSPKVEALFAGEPPKQVVPAGPRIRQLQLALAVALPLDLLGILCWTGVPGAVLTLWAYLSADAEMARIDAGTYSGEDAARLLRLRSIATWALYFCVASFLVQAWLMSTSFYSRLFATLWRAVAAVFGLATA